MHGAALKESADLVILGVTFDANMTFQKHLSSVPSNASQRLGIVRKSWQVFHDQSLLLRFLWNFVLPSCSINCSAVCYSAADLHIKLLYKYVRIVFFSSLTILVTLCLIAWDRRV